MSENLMDSVAPHLAAPVTRTPVQTATELGEGATPSELCWAETRGQYCSPSFADDDAE